MTNTLAIKLEYNKMSDQQQKLSTLLDDYRGTDEDLLALSELQSDVNQQYTQQRYQMIGDVMRNELPDAIQMDFTARVRTQLADEAALNVQPERSNPSSEPTPSPWWSAWFKPVAGLAVAASVAVVTVSSLQLGDKGGEASQSVAVNDGSQARVEQLAQTPVVNNAVRVSGNPSAASAPPSGTTWTVKRGKPDIQDKLNTYLINHNEHSSSMRGIIPQARVVGFDGQR